MSAFPDTHRSARYQLTKNNPHPECLTRPPAFSRVELEFFGFAQETAPSTGTPHLQGFFIFKKPRAFGAVKKDLARDEHWRGAHIEVMVQPLSVNLKYCTKEKPLTVLCGAVPEDGFKDDDGGSDISRAYALAQRGEFDELGRRYTEIYLRYYSALHAEGRRHPQPEYIPPHRERALNFWIWGTTGTGKTRGVDEYFGPHNVAKCPPGSQERELSFSGQRVYFMDDFDHETARSCKLQWMKQVTDHGPFAANYRYAHSRRMIRPEIVVITSNHRFEDVYGHLRAEDRNALARRFTIFHKTFDNEIPWDLWLNGSAPSAAASAPTACSPEPSEIVVVASTVAPAT